MLGLKLIHDNKIGGWCDRKIILPRSYYNEQWTLNDKNLKSACRNNINYTLPWRHTSVMVSQITGTSTVWTDELEYVFKSRESIWAYLSFSHFPDCPDRTKRILQKKIGFIIPMNSSGNIWLLPPFVWCGWRSFRISRILLTCNLEILFSPSRKVNISWNVYIRNYIK